MFIYTYMKYGHKKNYSTISRISWMGALGGLGLAIIIPGVWIKAGILTTSGLCYASYSLAKALDVIEDDQEDMDNIEMNKIILELDEDDKYVSINNNSDGDNSDENIDKDK